MRAAGALFLGFTLAGLTSVLADAPRVSVRPKPREATVSMATRTPPVMVYYHSEIRPKPRGGSGIRSSYLAPFSEAVLVVDVLGEAQRDGASVLASTMPVYNSPRPHKRPYGLSKRKYFTPKPTQQTRVASTAPTAPTILGRSGSICGDPRIKGERLSPIRGKLAGCGVADPVRVASIDGVVLSQQSIMDCTTARSLSSWVRNALKPTIRNRGGGVKSLSVPSHYSCRTRNSQPGAKISEHGKGHAIDISAINLKDGSQITVLKGWKNKRDKRILQKLHASACGPFGTVLGPNANRYHLDHFHFDTARYRGGPYCK